MLQIPENIKNLFRKDRLDEDTVKRIKLSFYEEQIDALYPYETLYPENSLFPSGLGEPWLVIENDRLVTESLLLTEALCSEKELRFGACEASKLEFICAEVQEDITGKEFVAIMEIGGYQMAFGIYRVFSAQKQADRRLKKVVAYDRMLMFDTDVSAWYHNLNFPVTIRQMRDSLCEYIGISQEQTALVNDGVLVDKTIDPKALTGREVLRSIGEINGAFTHVDKTGYLKYITLQQTGLFPSETLYPVEQELYPSESTEFVQESNYRSIDYEEYIVSAIDGLTIRTEEGDIGTSVGEGKNAYTIEGNFLAYGKNPADLQAIAEKVFINIGNRFYRPHTTKLVGLPYVEVGDGINIVTSDDMIETFVFVRKLSGLQALVDEYSASGAEWREELPSVGKSIVQLEGKSNVLTRNIEKTNSRITDVKKELESEITQTAGEIRAEVKKGDDELKSTITQTAEKITSEVKDVANNLGSKIEQNAKEISIKVSKDELLSEISTQPGKITLSSNRLIVNSSKFKLDGNGNATFSGRVKGAVIEGTEIIGGSFESTDGTFRVEAEHTYIGGFNTFISSEDDSQYLATEDQDMGIGGHYKYSFWTGWSGNREANCFINKAGLVYAQELRIMDYGKIEGDLNVYGTVTGGDWAYSSDRRLKEDINKLNPDQMIKLIMSIRPVSYYLKNDEKKVKHYGVIAQDLIEVLKELNLNEENGPIYRNGSDDGYLKINYFDFIAPMISAIQWQGNKIDELEERIARLEEKIGGNK